MAQTREYLDPAKLPVVFHPGETLDEKLQEMSMSLKEFATRVSKPEKTIIAVIKGKSAITPDMAIAFELVTRIPANMWLSQQRRYDEYVARKKREKIMQEGILWAKKFPLEEIQKNGWLANYTSLGGQPKDIVETLCLFFGVSSPKGWEEYYLNQRLRVAFRITLAESCDPYALSAWLRQGEIQANEIQLTNKYTSKGLKGIIGDISDIRKKYDKDYKEIVSELLATAGVKLVFTEVLSSAPVKGSSRYIGGVPCIQLAKSFDTNEEFWHTLFHEIGHIILHGRKNIFIENVEYCDKNPEMEREANEFASSCMSR